MAEVTVLLDHFEPVTEAIADLIGGIVPDTVEVVVVDPGYMRVMNRRFRHLDQPTDVLSFDLADSEDERPMGTIYVDGRLFPPMEELLERVFHGYLHLCGYTHDSSRDSERMREAVRDLVNRAMKGES